jgi:hypothetical protein
MREHATTTVLHRTCARARGHSGGKIRSLISGLILTMVRSSTEGHAGVVSRVVVVVSRVVRGGEQGGSWWCARHATRRVPMRKMRVGGWVWRVMEARV